MCINDVYINYKSKSCFDNYYYYLMSNKCIKKGQLKDTLEMIFFFFNQFAGVIHILLYNNANLKTQN